jgi:cytochrome c
MARRPNEAGVTHLMELNRMIRTVLAGSLVAAALISGTAQAADSTAVATQYGCLGCHAVAAKVLGPSFQEVAAKYKGDAGAPAALAAKVRAGGVGSWGQIPMPPQAGPTDDELKAIVGWILATPAAK